MKFILAIFSVSIFVISACSKNNINDVYSTIDYTPELNSYGGFAKTQLNNYIGCLYSHSKQKQSTLSEEEKLEIEKLFNEWGKLPSKEFEKPLIRQQAQNIIQKYNTVGCKLREV